MRITSISAIYLLFWWGCLFLILPLRLRKNKEPEAYVPGQAESAPPGFSLPRTLMWTTIVSIGAFGLFYLNFLYGWITAGAFDLTDVIGRHIAQ